jgi:hypothetical protein
MARVLIADDESSATRAAELLRRAGPSAVAVELDALSLRM